MAGGTTVTVSGSGFALGTSGTVFTFGKVMATSVNCTTTSVCTVVAPAVTMANSDSDRNRRHIEQRADPAR